MLVTLISSSSGELETIICTDNWLRGVFEEAFFYTRGPLLREQADIQIFGMYQQYETPLVPTLVRKETRECHPRIKYRPL